MQDLEPFIAAVRRLHGASISVMVARAPAFGNADFLLIVNGGRHADAAWDLARAIGQGSRVQLEHTTAFMGLASRSYSTVQWFPPEAGGPAAGVRGVAPIRGHSVDADAVDAASRNTPPQHTQRLIPPSAPRPQSWRRPFDSMQAQGQAQ